VSDFEKSVGTAQGIPPQERTTGRLKRIIGMGYASLLVGVFTADSRRIVVAGQRRIPTVRVWDIASGKMLVEPDELSDAVFGVAALADHQRFLSASRDGIVRVWRLKK
jgi:WD40 repeat protein